MSARHFIARHLLRLISRTWRIREELPDDCREIIRGNEIAVIAFWHGKMLPIWFRFRGRGYSAVVSGSRDGEILTNYLERALGYRDVIRGSSSKGGSRVLAEMAEALSERSCLITPDGPRGPARKGKPGALLAAGRSNRRLMMAGWYCRRKFTIRSWDSMEIPFPFSRITIRYCIFNNILKNRDQQITEEDLQSFDAALERIS